MACGCATTGLLFTPRDRHEYNFYLFLFLIGTTPIATDFWSDLDKQGDGETVAIILSELRHVASILLKKSVEFK